MIPLRKSLPNKARSIARAKSGGLYLPSDATTFQDSTGTIAGTMDAVVGLRIDQGRGGLGALGAEQLTNGDFSSGSTGWTVTGNDANHIVTFSGGTCRYQSVGSTPVLAVSQPNSLVLGKLYRIVAVCSSYTMGAVKYDSAGTSVDMVTGLGTRTTYFYSTSTTFSFYRSGDPIDLTIDSISIKEVPGIHTTQTVAGQKPILRQGAKNMFLNSATLSTQGITTAATTYTVHFTGTGTITFSGTYSGSLIGTGVSDRVSKTFTCTAGTLTCTVSGSVTAAMAELGSVASTYVATTTAPASNGIGPSWDDYAGTDDNTVYTSVPISMATDHCVMIACQPLTTGTIFSCGNTSTGTPRISIGFDASGYITATWKDDAATTATITGSTNLFGTRCIVEIERTGNNKLIKVNGVQIGATDTTVMGTATLNAAKQGCLVGVADSSFIVGRDYGTVIIPTTSTASERDIERRYLAAVAGVAL